MTLWTSIITVLVFSFVVIGLDEYFHWTRRRKKQQDQQDQQGQGKPPTSS